MASRSDRSAAEALDADREPAATRPLRCAPPCSTTLLASARQRRHPHLCRESLKEELRLAIRLKGEEGVALLGHWLAWASRCRIPAFVELARKVRRRRVPIEAALRSGASNALVESTNTKIRVLTRVAFGFRSPRPSSPWPCWPWAGAAPRCPAGAEGRRAKGGGRRGWRLEQGMRGTTGCSPGQGAPSPPAPLSDGQASGRQEAAPLGPPPQAGPPDPNDGPLDCPGRSAGHRGGRPGG